MNNQGVVNNKWFILYFLSNTLSRFGENVYALAIPFLVLELKGDFTTFITVFTVEYLPYLVIGPFIGNFLDKGNRRTLLLLTDIFRFFLLVSIPLLIYLGYFHFLLLLIIAFLITTVIMINRILSEHSVLPFLVSREKLNKANAFYTGSTQVAQAAGQIFAGLMIAFFGASNTLLLNSLMYIIPIFVIAFIPIRFSDYSSKRSDGSENPFKTYWNELKEGFKYFRDNHVLTSLTYMSWFTNLARAAFYTILLYYLASENELSSIYIGIMFSVVMVFGLLSSAIGPKIIKRFDSSKLSLYSFLVIFASFTFIGMYFVNWMFVIVLFIIEFMITNIRNMVGLNLRQLEIPDNLVGRTNGFIRCIVSISYPLSAALFGFIANHWNTKTTFLIMGLIHLIVGLIYILKLQVIITKKSENQKKTIV